MMDMREFFLKQKQATHQGTIGVLAKIPPGRIQWKPADGMLSLGEIVRHVWMSEAGLRTCALENRWDYFEKRIPLGLSGTLGEVQSVDEETAQLDRVHQRTLEAVTSFPLERWEEERVNQQFNIRRKVYAMLFGMIEHQIHHRAQIGAYLHVLTGERASPYAL